MRVRRPTAFALGVLILASCSSSPQAAYPSVQTGPSTSSAPGDAPPIRRPDRAPVEDRVNGRNDEPPAPAPVNFPEFEEIRADWLIPESPQTARDSTRDAARSFAAALAASIRRPEPSALNFDVPGLKGPISVPSSLNYLARAALYRRDGASGADVGPSRPAADGRLWVAVFQGASGPLGAVVPVCFGVTLRADAGAVLLEIVEIPSHLPVQPAARTDIPKVICEVNLETTPDLGFVPAN